MFRSCDKFSFNNLVKAFLPLMLLLVAAFAVQAVAQNTEQTWGDSSVPLVYNMENTGAQYPAPTFPSLAQLPIIRPLPDPFVFFVDGRRDTTLAAWEQRRNEIFSAVQNYMRAQSRIVMTARSLRTLCPIPPIRFREHSR